MKKTITVLCLLLYCLTGCRADPPEPPPETVWTTQETEKAVPVPSENNVPLRTADQVEVPVTEFDTFVLREIQPYDPKQTRLGDIHYFIPLPSGNWMCAETDANVMDKNGDYTHIPKMYGYIDKGGFFKLPYSSTLRNEWYQTLLLEMTDGTSIYKVDKNTTYMGTFINGVAADADYRWIDPDIGEMIYENYYIGAINVCSNLLREADCGGLWHDHIVKYALYHEYEKLTEAKYLEIFRTEDAFVAVYKTKEELFMTDILDDNGEILRTEEGDTSGQYPKIPYVTYKPYEVCQDTETELYYYAKEDGQPLCEPMFTYCTRISEAGTAIVKYEEKLCVLELKPEPEPETVMYFGIRYVDADPPYQYMEEDTLPDFLTEEQKILYRQALSIFRFFSGNSMGINDFIVLQEGEVIHNTIIQADNGYSYCQVNGKYRNWNDFHNMILHVFTKEYFDVLNRNSKGIEKFIRIDGNTCAILADKGSVPGYGIVPDTYELVSASEDEIVFDVTCGYQNGTDPETGEAVIEYRTFEVILQKTEEGWRFSEFNCGAWYRELPS